MACVDEKPRARIGEDADSEDEESVAQFSFRGLRYAVPLSLLLWGILLWICLGSMRETNGPAPAASPSFARANDRRPVFIRAGTRVPVHRQHQA